MDSLVKFLATQHRKLKPDGKIRIVIGNQNSHTPATLQQTNNYALVAQSIESDPRIMELYNINLHVMPNLAHNEQQAPVRDNINATYARKLREMGLNPFNAISGVHDFEHRRTLNGNIVNVWSDIVLEGTMRPTLVLDFGGDRQQQLIERIRQNEDATQIIQELRILREEQERILRPPDPQPDPQPEHVFDINVVD